MNFEARKIPQSVIQESATLNTNVDKVGVLSLPDGRTISFSNIEWKGPLETATYEGTTETGESIIVATKTEAGVSKVTSVWLDGKVIFEIPNIH